MNANKSLYRNAPDPKNGQKRVFHTLQHVVEHALGATVRRQRDDFFLGQGVLAPGVEETIKSLMEQGKSQDEAVLSYIKGEIGNPVSDANGLMHRLDFGIQALNFGFIKKNADTIQPGAVFGKFVMVRHGEKAPDGNLTENGVIEAQQAGKEIKEKHGDMMPTAIFACQQPTVQTIMMACLSGEHEEHGGNGKNASQAVWEKWMPDARKAPYKTGEVTTFELALSAHFKTDELQKLSGEEETKYLKQHTILMIERNGYKKQFQVSDIDAYFATMDTIAA